MVLWSPCTRNNSVVFNHRAMSKSFRNEQRYHHRVAMLTIACDKMFAAQRVWTSRLIDMGDYITSHRATMMLWTSLRRVVTRVITSLTHLPISSGVVLTVFSLSGWFPENKEAFGRVISQMASTFPGSEKGDSAVGRSKYQQRSWFSYTTTSCDYKWQN